MKDKCKCCGKEFTLSKSQEYKKKEWPKSNFYINGHFKAQGIHVRPTWDSDRI